jgi:hypothetical protein
MKDLAIFENLKIRRHYVDIVAMLTEQRDYKKVQSYWTTLKGRLKEEGNQLVTNCEKLKLQSAEK